MHDLKNLGLLDRLNRWWVVFFLCSALSCEARSEKRWNPASPELVEGCFLPPLGLGLWLFGFALLRHDGFLSAMCWMNGTTTMVHAT
jgi:hypothetical protein